MKHTVIGFIAGAAIGALVSWKITKRKYEAIADEEIRSVKEVYARDKREQKNSGVNNAEKALEKVNETLSDLEKNIYKPTAEDREKVEEMINKVEYRTGTMAEKGDQKGHPYTITPSEFASSNEYYDKISLNLYGDGHIEDEDGTTWSIDEVENSVGLKNLDSIGEYEKGVLYVRNDILQTDYEIIEDV